MKKLSYLIVLTLILGLVLTGCFLSNIGQVPTSEQSGVSSIAKNGPLRCIDFESTTLLAGDSVKGEGKVSEWLKISLEGKELILIESEETDPTKSSYRAGNPAGYNKCLEGSYGFGCQTYNSNTSINRDTVLEDGDIIVFEFPTGMKVKDFSILMLDFGDYYETSGNHIVSLKAYGELEYEEIYSNTNGDFPTSQSKDYDACLGANGIKTLNISGKNIHKVELKFVEGIDIGIAFDYICFTPETNVCSTNLIAGQDFDDPVGDVKVEYTPGNDFITVTYSTEAPWLMEEIHFHASFGDPDSWLAPVVNKAGNPAPGHFLVVDEDLGGSNSESFLIPLSDIGTAGCGPLYFAAHAKVYKLSNLIPRYIVSEASTSMVHVYLEEGSTGNPSISPISSNNSVEVSYDSWDNYFSTSGTGGSYESNGLGMSKWISDSEPWNTSVLWDASISSWREFLRSFLIPNNAVNLSGNLVITSDNAEEVKLNESPIWVCGVVYGPVPSSPSLGWKDVNDYNITSYLNTGNNDLTIWVRNWAQSGGSTNAANNPTGLIYRLNYKYQLKFEETAWGDGPSFPDAKNWSMYFKCLDLVPCPFTP